MAKIRVLVVDDSVVIRRLVSDVLSADAAIEVIGVAANGRIALDKVAQLKPDLVTMDVEMPELDGLQALKEIRKTDKRLPVVMFSTLTDRGAATTIEALSLGASDYVTKPSNVGSMTMAIARIREQLIPKVKALCGSRSFEFRVPSQSETRNSNSKTKRGGWRSWPSAFPPVALTRWLNCWRRFLLTFRCQLSSSSICRRFLPGACRAPERSLGDRRVRRCGG
jgi:chemotaxis response regulator CheB